MKHSLLIFFALILHFSTIAQVTLLNESFESDGEGTRYTSNTYVDCTNSDFFLRTNTNPVTPPGCSVQFGTALTNLQGSYFWASEDIRSNSPPNSKPPGDITFNSFSILGYISLNVSLYLATSNNNNIRWESADSINVKVSINGGDFVAVGRFVGDNVSGGRLRVDANLNGIGETTETAADQATFTKYTFSIPYTGNTLQLKLDFDQLGGTEELAIDAIEVKGTYSPTPVELINFDVKTEGGKNVLIWATASEVNSNSFDIERSSDGQTFVKVGSVKALGKAAQYNFLDLIPLDGINYYRLKAIDNDATFEYSKIISTQANQTNHNIKIYPTVTEGGIIIENIVGDVSKVSVLNVMGQLVYANKSSNYIDLSEKPSGVYFVQIEAGNKKVTRKIFKK